MTVSYSPAPDVAARSRMLALPVPEGIALLPRNFFDATTSDELLHDRDVLTIRKLWRQAGVTETPIDSGTPFPRLEERSARWVVPVIFLGAAALSENPAAVSLALNIVANYITDVVRGITGQRDVVLEVIAETKSGTKRQYKRISYEGPVEGLAELRKAVENLTNED